MKKCEKERNELQKSVEYKEGSMLKMKKERDEVFAIVNTDRYRNFKSADADKVKYTEKIKTLEEGFS